MIKAIFDQPSVQTLSPSAKKIHYFDLPLIAIDHPLCHAIISFQGAQLLLWAPTGESRPILWLSEKALFQQQKAIRGGIPICWPWFGRSQTPAHGFARLLEWDLLSLEENQEGVKLQLGLRDSHHTHTLWPHSFEATMIVHLGNTAYIEFSYRGNFTSTAALHTYFNVDNIKNTSVSGLGTEYQEAGMRRSLTAPASAQIIAQETDRIYTCPEAVSYLHDSDRVIKVTHHNASDVVLWNPWKEGSEKIIDMTKQGYTNMVCIETACIHTPLKASISTPAKFGVTIEKMR